MSKIRTVVAYAGGGADYVLFDCGHTVVASTGGYSTNCGARAVLRERFIGDESDETCLMCGRSVVTPAELQARDEYLKRRTESNREAVVASPRAINGTYWKEAS